MTVTWPLHASLKSGTSILTGLPASTPSRWKTLARPSFTEETTWPGRIPRRSWCPAVSATRSSPVATNRAPPGPCHSMTVIGSLDRAYPAHMGSGSRSSGSSIG